MEMCKMYLSKFIAKSKYTQENFQPSKGVANKRKQPKATQ